MSGGRRFSIGDDFPNFKATTTDGEIDFHEWLGDSWGVLFSHPSDFTPVCTTELGRLVRLMSEFEKRNVKVIGLSCDDVDHHVEWMRDIKAYIGAPNVDFPFPLIADADRRLAVLLNMLDMDEKDAVGIPLTARAVFVIDPKKKFRLSILYPAIIGRNFKEILRAIDALQLTEKYPVSTPADWKVGEPCMVLPTVSEEEANAKFPRGVTVHNLPSGKKYLRQTPQP